MAALYKLHAPSCAFPSCHNKVSYHKKKGLTFNWKTFCEEHRNSKKVNVDAWKLKQGCANIDARYMFKCTSHITSANQLDLHHKDGNKYNNDPENTEILCKVCHSRIGHEEKHHLQRYQYRVELDPNLFEF